MRIIYEPRGRAKEYSDLAVNTYAFCPHACVYCYAKNVMHKSAEEFHSCAIPRTEPIKRLFEKDCAEMERNMDGRRVHMNFVSDPYPSVEKELHLTRYCIETATKHGVGINILTKGRYDVVRPDFELFRIAGVHFGVTCCWYNDKFRQEWEPGASSVQDRVRLLKEAHGMGIFTWVSMEPVINPDEALAFFKANHENVNMWKVGKLNYHPHSKEVDWPKFRDDFIRLADSVGATYVIKKDLLDA